MSKQTNPQLEQAVPRSLRHWEEPETDGDADLTLTRNAVLPMGWGRLIFAHTFDSPDAVADVLCEEKAQERDIAFYLRDPHVVLSLAPHQLFMDPSHTFRLWFNEPSDFKPNPQGFYVREVRTVQDEEAINRIYAANGMVTVAPDFLMRCRHDERIQHWVAICEQTGDVLGTVTGVDHQLTCGDPEGGSSMWCLSVAPEAPYPGIGRNLVAHAASFFRDADRQFMDLSVMHDNKAAISLYKSMGFQRVPVFTIKRKNPINEPLYIAPAQQESLNPYADIIVKEARRRGIRVMILDADAGLFTLTFGGRTIFCRESLTDLTSAVVLATCDDKRVTQKLLAEAGLRIPKQHPAATAESDAAFLAEVGRVVVKPVRGEQGQGISVDLATKDELAAAVATARKYCSDVLIEEYVKGVDLRILVIDHDVVAAAVRLPPTITGTGRHSVEQLIAKQSRRRQAATGGESSIPMDAETTRCVTGAGYSMDDILPEGETITVRKTANLHTGGILQDVTDRLHPDLRKAAVEASKVLRIPVTGLDFIVTAPDQADYVIIEANERPGLANHEPQPTAERFIDLLFPNTAATDTAANSRG